MQRLVDPYQLPNSAGGGQFIQICRSLALHQCTPALSFIEYGEKILNKYGYTNEIIEDEIPETSENQYIEEYYEQKDGVIYKHYRVIGLNKEEIGGI